MDGEGRAVGTSLDVTQQSGAYPSADAKGYKNQTQVILQELLRDYHKNHLFKKYDVFSIDL